MESLSHIVSIVASLTAIVGPPAAGLVPRLGPLRAVVLGLSTRFARSARQSLRADELRDLRSMLATAERDQYVVVAGPEGVGKTCLVDTALERTAGVVSVRVAAGAAEKEILADAFKAIARSSMSFLDHSGSARRILWWHHLFFRVPATVVLRAAERKPSQTFADLDSAARSLTHDFGARVLIDASTNSLPEAATATKREKLLELEPMPRGMLEALPELQPLLAALKAAGLADAVWMVVGGNPADYKGLLGAWQDARGGEGVERAAAAFVQNLIGKAIDNVRGAVAHDDRLQTHYDSFRGGADVLSAALGFVRPSPDKVLRAVQRRTPAGARGSGGRILVPADAATAVVLRHGLTDTPSVAELRALASGTA